MSDEYLMNRLNVAKNPYQREYKKVLCVCSAGVLRSPTAAVVLATDFGCNTRAAGITREFALISVDQVLLTWADEIVCMDEKQQQTLTLMCEEFDLVRKIINLDIPDSFSYRDSILISTIRTKYAEATIKKES